MDEDQKADLMEAWQEVDTKNTNRADATMLQKVKAELTKQVFFSGIFFCTGFVRMCPERDCIDPWLRYLFNKDFLFRQIMRSMGHNLPFNDCTDIINENGGK